MSNKPELAFERVELAKRWAVSELKAPAGSIRRDVAETIIALGEQHGLEVQRLEQRAAKADVERAQWFEEAGRLQLQLEAAKQRTSFPPEQPSGVVEKVELSNYGTLPAVPMMLQCPHCGCYHVDGGEWATRPHKTHQCQHFNCGHEWRPHEYPTVGIPPDSIAIPPTLAQRETK